MKQAREIVEASLLTKYEASPDYSKMLQLRVVDDSTSQKITDLLDASGVDYTWDRDEQGRSLFLFDDSNARLKAIQFIQKASIGTSGYEVIN